MILPSRLAWEEDAVTKSKSILMRSINEKQIFVVQVLQTTKSEPQKKFAKYILAKQKYISLS